MKNKEEEMLTRNASREREVNQRTSSPSRDITRSTPSMHEGVHVTIPDPFIWRNARSEEKPRPMLSSIDIPSRLRFAREMQRYLKARRAHFQEVGIVDPYAPSLADGVSGDVRRAIIMAAKYGTEEPRFVRRDKPTTEEDFRTRPVIDWISLQGAYQVSNAMIEGKSIKETIKSLLPPRWKEHGLETALAKGLEEIRETCESECPHVLVAGGKPEKSFVKSALRDTQFLRKWCPPLIDKDEILAGGMTWQGLIEHISFEIGDVDEGLERMSKILWTAALRAVKHHPKAKAIQAYHLEKPKPSDPKKRPGKNRDAGKGPGKKRKKTGDKNVYLPHDPDAEKTWEAIKRSEPALTLLKKQAARSRDVCIVCGDKTQSCGGLQNIRGRIRNRPGDCKKASPYEKTRPFTTWKYLLERARGNDPGNQKKPKKNGARK